MKRLMMTGVLLTLLFACKEAPKKEKTGKLESMGAEYKLTETGRGEPVIKGNWIKIAVTQLYNDSVLHSGNDYVRYDSATMSAESYKVFSGIREGDSLHFKVSADSAFRDRKPEFAQKPGGWLITRVHVEKIYRSDKEYEQEVNPAGPDSLQKPESHE